MKTIRMFSVLLVILFAASHSAQAKSYSMKRISINAELLPSGDLKIEESRTYKFRGRYSWADYRLPLKGIGDIEDFTLRDEGGLYRNDSSGDVGTYVIESTQDELYVKWFYKARNETRTFILNYTITDVATVYDDIGELYVKFVGAANPKAVGNVDVTIRLPRPADTTNVRAWAHGPLWGEIRFDAGLLKMTVAPLPKETFWEARVLMPTAWLPDATKRESNDRLQSIMAEEADLARRANAARRRALAEMKAKKEREEKAWPIAIAVVAFGVLAWGFLYAKFGRGAKVPYASKIDSTIPEMPPVQASFIYYSKSLTGGAIMATILDLGRRGFVSIEEPQGFSASSGKREKEGFTIRLQRSDWKSSGELTVYEADLLAFLFEELAPGSDSVTLKSFKKNRSKVRRWFSHWQKLIKKEYAGHAFWDKQSIRGTIASAVIAGLVTTAGILLLVFMGTPGVIALIGGIVLEGLSFAILSYTPETKLLRKKLTAFRTYLKRYHFQSDDLSIFLKQVQQYLTYGIALGIGKKAIEKMMGMLPEHQHVAYFPWYVAHGGTTPVDFAGAMTSFVTVATSTVSSASGAGGGAAAGGGGGAGGAAGGAG